MPKLLDQDPPTKKLRPPLPARNRWPRILFCGASDWGNLCNRISRGINAYVGQTISRVWTLDRNPFQFKEDFVGPPTDAEGDLPAGLIAFARWGLDWIVSIGDGHYDILNQQFDELAKIGCKAGALAVTHAGSAFRAEPARLHEADWDLGAKVRFVGYDSIRLVPTDPMHEIATYPYWSSCETFSLIGETAPELIRVSHSPTSRDKKGTEIILDVFNRLAKDKLITYDLIEGVSYPEAVARRARSQIFVDQLKPEIGGFGCAAIEAMGAGCLVISDVRNVKESEGDVIPPIQHVGDGLELEAALRAFCDVGNRMRLLQMRTATQLWALEHAAPSAVGQRFLAVLEAHR